MQLNFDFCESHSGLWTTLYTVRYDPRVSKKEPGAHVLSACRCPVSVSRLPRAGLQEELVEVEPEQQLRQVR